MTRLSDKLTAIKDAITEIVTTEPDLEQIYELNTMIAHPTQRNKVCTRTVWLKIVNGQATYHGTYYDYEFNVAHPLTGRPTLVNKLNKFGTQFKPKPWDAPQLVSNDYDRLLKIMHNARGKEFVNAFQKHRPEETD